MESIPNLTSRLIHNRRQKLPLISRRRARRQDLLPNRARRKVIQHRMIRHD